MPSPSARKKIMKEIGGSHNQPEKKMKCKHNHVHATNDSRRRLLLQGLVAGAFATLLPAGSSVAAGIAGPQQLPVNRSIYRVSGRAWVNGKRVGAATRIGPNDTIKTSHDGELVFLVGNHAMLLRGGSHLELHAAESSMESSPVIGLLRLLAGKLLSASRHPGMRIETPGSTIGIRGTGVYLEAGPEKTFFCTCYGDTDIAANNDPASKDTVHATHHDRPLFIFNQAPSGRSIRNANDPEFTRHGIAAKPNHTDDELILIEALAGRTPPFMQPQA